MPIYEYTCPDCQNVFEEWLKASEATENAACPKCGAQAQRIISNTAFVLKGGGWYVTDYGYRKGTGEDGAASKAETPATPSATAAPAAAPETGASPAPTPAPATPSQPPASTATNVSA